MLTAPGFVTKPFILSHIYNVCLYNSKGVTHEYSLINLHTFIWIEFLSSMQAIYIYYEYLYTDIHKVRVMCLHETNLEKICTHKHTHIHKK